MAHILDRPDFAVLTHKDVPAIGGRAVEPYRSGYWFDTAPDMGHRIAETAEKTGIGPSCLERLAYLTIIGHNFNGDIHFHFLGKIIRNIFIAPPLFEGIFFRYKEDAESSCTVCLNLFIGAITGTVRHECKQGDRHEDNQAG